jgi:hypothetical protein
MSNCEQKPCNQNCPKCGGNEIHRAHRQPGESVKKSFGEKSDCKPVLPWLDSDWPYGWKVKREHIGHHCCVCGHEWECDVLPNADSTHG